MSTLQLAFSQDRTPYLVISNVKAECKRINRLAVPVISVDLDNYSFANRKTIVVYTIVGGGTSITLLGSNATNVPPNTQSFTVPNLPNGTFSITANVPGSTANAPGVGGNTLSFTFNRQLCDGPFGPDPVWPTIVLSPCIDFDNPAGNISQWFEYGVDNLMFKPEPGHGNVLSFDDDSGASMVYTTGPDFTGNWLEKGDTTCFCFDYKVDWNSSVSTAPVYAPKINLYKGPNPPNWQQRAAFIGNTSSPIPDNVWKRYCLPIGTCVGGALPSNANGTWQIFDYTISSSPLTGTAACAVWNNIITMSLANILCLTISVGHVRETNL